MDLQTDHAWRSRGRKTENVGEVCIQRHQHSATFDGEGSHFVVRFSRQPRFGDGDSIMALLPKPSRMLRGEILVKKELHVARTISLLAKPAAYFRAAVIW